VTTTANDRNCSLSHKHGHPTALGITFDNQHTVLIRDTPKDIEAGLTAGVRVFAVVSDKRSAKELRAAGATVIVDDLTDSEYIAQLVTRPNALW
jgi:phosphoglycolate phosphatase-like HAD superfamily hydrolase